MIFIERWLDILSILVIGGTIGAFYFLGKRRRAHRLLSEKPATYLEFTGKQIIVRQQKSKLVPLTGEEREASFGTAETPTTDPFIDRVREDLALLRTGCLGAARNFLRARREYPERWRFLMTAASREAVVLHPRLAAAIRARLGRSIRRRHVGTGGLLSHHSGRALTDRIRQAGAHWRWNLDVHGYRVALALEMLWRKLKALPERLANAPSRHPRLGVSSPPAISPTSAGTLKSRNGNGAAPKPPKARKLKSRNGDQAAPKPPKSSQPVSVPTNRPKPPSQVSVRFVGSTGAVTDSPSRFSKYSSNENAAVRDNDRILDHAASDTFPGRQAALPSRSGGRTSC